MHTLLSALWRRLFPRLSKYDISPRALRAMKSFAKRTHPSEAFGVLTGNSVGDTLVVQRVVYQPFYNTENSATAAIDRYAIDDLVGTFHSHPTSDHRPSKADKRLFAHYGGLHCIVAYPYKYAAVYDKRARLLDVISIPSGSAAGVRAR